MARLFGCPIDVEDDGGGSSIAVEVSLSRNQPDNGEATSFSAALPPTIPYFRFLDSNSDSGSVSMESESDLRHCFIDFFDRESYIGSNQRVSTSYDDFNSMGVQDMDEEEEIELGLRIGFGSGSGSDHSGGLGLRAAEIETSRGEVDTGRVEVDTGRVEVDSGRVEVDSGRVEEDTGRVQVETGRVQVETGRVEVETGRVVAETGRVEIVSDLTLVESEANLFRQEEEEEVEGISLHMDYSYTQEDEEQNQDRNAAALFDAFFESSFDDIFDSPLELFFNSIYEHGENHGDYEDEDDDDVVARTFDDDSGVMGSPPASKRVVDELPDVAIITSEELSIGCAICKDEIVAEEEGKVKRLPCKHYYHGECIVPWLGIRNTCPVCRYELPTDDLEYERNRRAQRGLDSDLMSE